MELRIGAARELITPEPGGRLMGYKHNLFSESLHDDLTVTAFALFYGETSAILMSATVCLINNDLVKRIRDIVGIATGVLPANVILSATHTHSGPCTDGIKGGGLDAEYCEDIFIPRCVSAAKIAAAIAKPAKMGIGVTETRVGVNRRQLLPDGGVILGQNPWGVYDPTMTVISFMGTDGATLANLVHCGAHCTASGVNREITRDWAGVMVDRLEKESGAITAFFNGAEGDIAPRIANGRSVGDISHAMEVGGLAGIDAVRAYKSIRAYYNEDLSVATGKIRIPQSILPLEEAKMLLSKYADAPPTPVPDPWKTNFEEIISLYDSGEIGFSEWTFNQTIIRIGPVAFIPFPFEPFSQISLRLREYGKFGHILLLGCTNGSNSYLATQDQLCRGGYEIDSFRWSMVRRLPDDADTRIINENIRIMEAL